MYRQSIQFPIKDSALREDVHALGALIGEMLRVAMRDRYGDNIPFDGLVISPASMFNSDLLVTIKSN